MSVGQSRAIQANYYRFHIILTLYQHSFFSFKIAANLNYLYIAELSTDISVSAVFVFFLAE